ncbi:MAG: hypothetical protein GC160_01995 [Acidobacteria bacterium]|nr:hypothetical protein [Acidobacteriota bacterium]
MLGPIPPSRVRALLLPPDSQAWLALGFLNIVIHSKDPASADAVLRYCRDHTLQFEQWEILDGKVISPPNTSDRIARDRAIRDTLVTLTTITDDEPLNGLLSDFAAISLTASELSRAIAPTWFASDVSHSCIQLSHHLTSEKDPHTQFTIVTNSTAALESLCCHALAGASPIHQSSGHPRFYSLLGTGIAEMALARLRAFVQEIVGEARIPSQLKGFASRPVIGSLARLPTDDPIWTETYIIDRSSLASATAAADLGSEPIYPLLTYLSDIDHFRTTGLTLSAPRPILTSCNSLSWTLLTLTHEISHCFIDGVFNALLPEFSPTDGIISGDAALALSLIEGATRPDNLLDSIRQYLLLTFLTLAGKSDAGNPSRLIVKNLDSDKLANIITRHYEEVTEIMVHVFDFLYFYRGQPQKYISSIWHSWGVIPDVGNRVSFYLIRTIAAVVALHISDPGNSIYRARDIVRAHLVAIRDANPGLAHVAKAVSLIDNDWALIEERVGHRLPLIQIVKTFLYSESVSAQLHRDIVPSRSRRKLDPQIRPNRFPDAPVESPLEFIDSFTSNCAPRSDHSAWILTMLAFCEPRYD